MEERVAIYEDGNDQPILTGTAYFDVNPQSSARLISHPVENGQKVFDNKVNEPTRISVVCGITKDNTDAVAKIYQMLESRAFSFYTIKSLSGYWNNMSLSRVSERTTSEKPFTMAYNLEFQEILFVNPKATKRQDPANESTKA